MIKIRVANLFSYIIDFKLFVLFKNENCLQKKYNTASFHYNR